MAGWFSHLIFSSVPCTNSLVSHEDQQAILGIYKHFRLDASPLSIVDPSSPECDTVTEVLTAKEQKMITYPYLKPIKDSQSEARNQQTQNDRCSPDIPIYAPIPVKKSGQYKMLRNLIHRMYFLC